MKSRLSRIKPEGRVRKRHRGDDADVGDAGLELTGQSIGRQTHAPVDLVPRRRKNVGRSSKLLRGSHLEVPFVATRLGVALAPGLRVARRRDLPVVCLLVMVAAERRENRLTRTITPATPGNPVLRSRHTLGASSFPPGRERLGAGGSLSITSGLYGSSGPNRDSTSFEPSLSSDSSNRLLVVDSRRLSANGREIGTNSWSTAPTELYVGFKYRQV